ncbi:restriction endonuclease subunit M [Acidihalobacter yilgarnensis]|uniref:site-specific DNA-methyltransferase (adenine-specific) n=1 Tax=Acidihalobacter yilgarnensis TaxID=2819280 RepID=A0A1D8IK18_9GAMM|nr:class I SAM-dependent DNA methyltransferase [Acidihalobacter yilgarnensis]AOU96795.1 restriction endonuclease subunit M [Acidihalobacter yilgarnensis]
MKQEEQQFLSDLDKRLWTMANKLLPMLDAAVYKHVVLGLIFLKYVSDSFKERREALNAAFRDPENDYYLGDDGEELIEQELEARDYFTEKNVFWVPALARWDFLQANAKVALGTVLEVKNGKIYEYKFNGIGRLLDDALEAVEKENPKLKGVLEKDYARKQIDAALPGLIDLIAEIPFKHGTLHAKDILGHVYEYFLGEFAMAEGKKGGQYYTPKSIVTTIVEMLEPYQGRVYDPCCGSGGFFVQSEKFVEEHGGRIGQLSVYGQESNPTTWRLACMNLAIRGMDFDLGKEPASTYTRDQHPDLRADFIMANPPFNMKEWNAGVKDDDPRWQYGIPPANNANFAWMQHMIHHLAPHGSMALLLANGSMSSNTNNEGEIRKALIEADLVECMVALPGQLFTNTQIPACIWFLTKTKQGSRHSAPSSRHSREGGNPEFRNRKGETLFIDARNLGYMKDRVLRDFAPEDIRKIADTFHAWKSDSRHSRENGNPVAYEDIPGFCKSATLEYIQKHEYVLTPGRYVGAAEQEADSEPFEDKMARLTAQLSEQFGESARLEAVIRENLARLGYGG